MPIPVSKEPTKISEVFEVAREILSSPDRWAIEAWGRNADGKKLMSSFVVSRHNDVEKVCLGGACLFAIDNNEHINRWSWASYASSAARRLGYDSYDDANDRGGYAVAMEVLRIAEELSKWDEDYEAKFERGNK